MKNALILLAGGVGKRLGSNVPKQFLKIGNTNLIEHFLTNLDKKIFDIIIIALKRKRFPKDAKLLKEKFEYHKIIFVESGKTRQVSSFNALKFLKKYNPKNVLIHDSARPLVSNLLIRKIIKTLKVNYSCVPYVRYNDLIKTKKNLDLKNNDIIHIQTPQGFNFKKIYKAHSIAKKIDSKDDSSILQNTHKKIKMIKGEKNNIKITTKEDLIFFNNFRKKEYRSGIGFDIHKINFSSKRKLILCGIKINHPPLIGHSDADVCYHSICDSILGALSMRDIGYYFNNKNLLWKKANSKIFINFCMKKMIEKKYKIVNLDINFICETPNINNLSSKMKKNLSSLLKVNKKNISIKATTNEKVGYIGKGEAIAVQSIIQIVNE
tara:strand:- start:2037 stop:3173 length:1137 start_codon:yes stop_codon:yes gene_type:complete